MKKTPTQPVQVYSFPIEVSYVKGDKIIIHKCDIDKAIKNVKACYDPYGEDDSDRNAGKIDILKDLLDIIRRGKEKEADLKRRQEINRMMKEFKENQKDEHNKMD